MDGKIHDKEFLKTPDRIRQRALKNMAMRCRARMNKSRVHRLLLPQIIQKYYEVVDADDRTTHHESISDDHITKLITEFLIVNPHAIMCL
jgi:hypothetical protein